MFSSQLKNVSLANKKERKKERKKKKEGKKERKEERKKETATLFTIKFRFH